MKRVLRRRNGFRNDGISRRSKVKISHKKRNRFWYAYLTEKKGLAEKFAFLHRREGIFFIIIKFSFKSG